MTVGVTSPEPGASSNENLLLLLRVAAAWMLADFLLAPKFMFM